MKIFSLRGVEEIIEKNNFDEKLKSGKKLRVKMGVDPTRPDIHLGHAVGLRKLRELQEMGHTIIFLIGDYTTKIGDPSGRNSTRPVLSDEEIKSNAKSYLEQVGKILDVSQTEIRYNSEWFKKMDFNDVLQLAGKFTAAQILDRDDFKHRLDEGLDLSMHELLYPLMQAYDSVVLEADVEFGGSDQRFNMLAGRILQRKMNQPPQDIVITTLLVGLDGKHKMSKSYDNYIGVTDSPETMFGKAMSIPDSMIISYFELCTDKPSSEIEKLSKGIENGDNPRDAKLELAYEIVTLYHGKEEAEAAKIEFLNVFSKKELPTDMPEVDLTGTFQIILLLTELGAVTSKSEARRVIEQGGVKIDGVKISDPNAIIALSSEMVVQVGKRKFYKVK